MSAPLIGVDLHAILVAAADILIDESDGNALDTVWEDYVQDYGGVLTDLGDYYHEGSSDALFAGKSIEICPASLDRTHPPQSWPAIRLDITGEDFIPGVTEVGIKTATVEIRTFMRNARSVPDDHALAGRRGTLTQTTILGMAVSRVVTFTLAALIQGYTVGDEDNRVFNVVQASGTSKSFPGDDATLIQVNTYLTVSQRSLDPRGRVGVVPFT